MTEIQTSIILIKEKIEELDLVFLSEIKDRLAYKNPYFLVCLNEVVHRASSDLSIATKNLGMDYLVDYLNKKAEYLYLNSNISESFPTTISAWDGER